MTVITTVETTVTSPSIASQGPASRVSSSAAMADVFPTPGGVMETRTVQTRRMNQKPALRIPPQHATQHTSGQNEIPSTLSLMCFDCPGAGQENVSRAAGGATTTRTVRTALTRRTARPRTSESAQRRRELVTTGVVFTPPSGVTG